MSQVALVGVVAVVLLKPVMASEHLPPTASEVLALIEKNAGLEFAEAAADLAAARARLSGARAGLFPTATMTYEGERYDSTRASVKDKAEVFGGIEVVQPIYDFGITSNRIDAADAEFQAAENDLAEARNTVLLEGLALFFDLHASEMTIQALNQEHASRYVRWERAKERLELGQTSPLDVAEWLVRTEATRLKLHREQSRNVELRLRLQELTGFAFEGELFNPPAGPNSKPIQPELDKLQEIAEVRNPKVLALRKYADAVRLRREGTGSRPRIEAFGEVNHYSRSTTGRDEWTAGARVVWPIFDGGVKSAERAELAAEQGRREARYERYRIELRRRVQVASMARMDAWQQLVAARAGLDFARNSLLQRQRRYEQERVTDLGPIMGRFTEAEAGVIRAAGGFYLENARLAVLLGEAPAQGLKADFIVDIVGAEGVETEGDFVPKGGSGFGQEDQNELNRKVQ